MQGHDYDEFSEMLDSIAGLMSRGTYTPNATNTALYFRALRQHDIDLVRAGFDAHVRDTTRGRFMPTPADVLAQIDAIATNGRPGAEEAWAMVQIGEDETVVWTDEMAEAYGACTSLLQAGDSIAARMTFKEVYERLLALAKRTGKPAVWKASMGSDMDKRKRALTAAVAAGRLTDEAAFSACPALPMPESQLALLSGPDATRLDFFRQKINELAAAKAADLENVDRLEWAKTLRDREKRGEELSVVQQNAWRRALDAKREEAVGSFTPIPANCLPPGMRKATEAHP
ncbi:hypothetical protein DBR47_14435 [Paucibacter sp. KBW04]|uniref:hypothetical protein n=1 Tax=Paucibacter sp. KBW04 TaxID=2153361 RepID=UPI000F57E2E0|nr:hypothetical protein [Paucibacter sp. KBW04]RQO57986.1 hypothetical protein DBR47_14435 [Paucibacter sp. KBW04]